MGRPVYPHELNDPDFSWLVANFQEANPEYNFIESSTLPVVFILDTVPQFERTFLLPEGGEGELPATIDEKK